MVGVLSHLSMALAIWLVAGSILAWSWLPGHWRRLLALLASAAGLVFLVVAVNSEGLRESRTMAVLLVGTPYLVEQTAASASLPYYLLTGLCLLLGTAGLALGDDTARAMTRRWLSFAVGLSAAVTLLRFFMEKVAAPPSITQVFGITWLAPVVGAFFLAVLRAEGKGWGALAGRLYTYGLAARGFVTALYLAATWLHLGSHYDLSAVSEVRTPWGAILHLEPGSLAQLSQLVFVPQLVVWPVYTIISGFMGAAILRILLSASAPPSPQSPAMRADLPMAAAPDR
jgi:hypothetical protein